jgi:hypothetical protein
MEYLQGEFLRDLLVRLKKIPWKPAVRLIQPILPSGEIPCRRWFEASGDNSWFLQ